MRVPVRWSSMGVQRAMAFALGASALACGARTERATIVPLPQVETDAKPVSISDGTPSSGRLSRRNYVMDPARSHFDVFAADILTGEHKMSFDHWEAFVTVESKATIDVRVAMASASVDVPNATAYVKQNLLEVHRFPTATLSGILSKTKGPPDEHVVEGVAIIHGVKKGLRFLGTLKQESEGYRFRTSFVISRKEFAIRYQPLEPFLKDDVRIVVDAFAKAVTEELKPASDPERAAEAD